MDSVRSDIDSISAAGYYNDYVIGSKEEEQTVFALNAGKDDSSTNLKLIIVKSWPSVINSYFFVFIGAIFASFDTSRVTFKHSSSSKKKDY